MLKIFLIVAIQWVLLVDASALMPEEIVEKADEVRAPQKSFRLHSEVTAYIGEKEESVFKFIIYVSNPKEKGTRALVKFVYPPTEKGKLMLRKGSEMWVYIPGTRQPVRVPLQQRLIGQVANGDVAGVNLRQDYTPHLLGEDELEGKDCYLLDLIAEKKSTTYHRVKYWVEKKTFRPLKEEFYTVSGKKMKTAYYSDFKERLGNKRPTRLVIYDDLNKDCRTEMIYSDIEYTKLPAKYFTKSYLPYVQ